MATFKGLLKLKNAAGSFDIIMPKTEAGLVVMDNGKTVEEQVMLNVNIPVINADRLHIIPSFKVLLI